MQDNQNPDSIHDFYTEDFYRELSCDVEEGNPDINIGTDVYLILQAIQYHIHSTQCGIGELNNKLYYLDFKSKRMKILGTFPRENTDHLLKQSGKNPVIAKMTGIIEDAYLAWCHKEGLEHLVTGEPYQSFQARFVTCLRDLYERLTQGKSLDYKLSSVNYELTSDTSRLKVASGRKLFVRRKTRLYPRSGFARHDFELSTQSFFDVPGVGDSKYAEIQCTPVDNTYTVDLTLNVVRTNGQPYSHIDLYGDQRFRTIIDANFASESDMVKQRLHTDADRQILKIVVDEDEKDPIGFMQKIQEHVSNRNTILELSRWLARAGFEFNISKVKERDGVTTLDIMNTENYADGPVTPNGHYDHRDVGFDGGSGECESKEDRTCHSLLELEHPDIRNLRDRAIKILSTIRGFDDSNIKAIFGTKV